MNHPKVSTCHTDPIVELLTSYHELNSSTVEELNESPSALEFMRYVARNRPFVVRGGAVEWKATRTWNTSTLKDILSAQSVNVAVTPAGNADSPVQDEDGELLFAKPWEEEQAFEDFIKFVTEQELTGGTPGEVRYAQTQNDNLRGEYAALFSYVEKDISWARIALQQVPEAINLWIGNSRSVTALHKDNYENVYCQIIGQKHFVLLSPVSFACVAERELPSASYVRQNGGFRLQPEGDGHTVPFPTWDPDDVLVTPTKYSKFTQPLRLTLHAGDMLYLPKLWYHKVSQSCSEEGLCCAVNYWYDMDFGGSFYPLCTFVRSAALVALKT